MIFKLAVISVVALILGSIVYVTYWLPTKLGNKKIGKILSSVVALIISAFVMLETFKDQLFSNNDALELLNHQQITFHDSFEILDNSSSSAIGYSEHTFTLRLSDKDKKRIIEEFRNSGNYTNLSDSTAIKGQPYPYFTKKLRTQYFETDKYLMQKFHEPIAGYAPNFRIVTIEKSSRKLFFEDIDD